MTGSYGESGDFFGICYSCATQNGIIGVNGGNYGYFLLTGKRIDDGLWHTVLVSYDGTTLYIYVDTNLDNVATNWNHGGYTASIASTLHTLYNSANILGQFVGSLQSVEFYDCVVSNHHFSNISSIFSLDV